MSNYLRKNRSVKRSSKRPFSAKDLFEHDILTVYLKYPAVIKKSTGTTGVFLSWRGDFDNSILPEQYFAILNSNSAIAVCLDLDEFKNRVQQAYEYNQSTLFDRLVDRMYKVCNQFPNFKFNQTDTHVQIVHDDEVIFQEELICTNKNGRDYRIISIMQSRIPTYQKLIEIQQSNPKATIYGKVDQNNTLNIYDSDKQIFAFKFETNYLQVSKLHEYLGFA
jgi:hypothetical protein